LRTCFSSLWFNELTPALGPPLVPSGHEIPCPLWHLNIYCYVHRSPPLDLILSRFNPVDVLIHFFTAASHLSCMSVSIQRRVSVSAFVCLFVRYLHNNTRLHQLMTKFGMIFFISWSGESPQFGVLYRPRMVDQCEAVRI
jgi:hypothetical protein